MDNSINKVFHGTVVLILVAVLSKTVSFVQEAILAAYLGTSNQSDAYYMVSSISQVIFPVLSVGIFKVYLPVYKEKIALGQQQKANQLTDTVITVFTCFSILITILLGVFAKQVVSVISPGFSGETKELCIKLVQISAPMYIFELVSAIVSAVLQSHNKFFGSQICEAIHHIPIILAAVFLYRLYGVQALAISLVFGGLVRLLIQLPFINWGYRYKPEIKTRTTEFSLILKRLPSALLSAGITQLNTLIDKTMASRLPAGTISGLSYGTKLIHVFGNLISTAVTTAMYPQMVELIALKKTKELSVLMERIMNIFCILLCPITIACIWFRTEIVSAVFQRGAFNSDSVTLTAGVFALYAIGILFSANNGLLNDLFYGFGNTKTPMIISLVNLVSNLILNVILISLWGVNGLALATSLSAAVTFIIRITAARKYIKLGYRNIIRTGVIGLLLSFIACGVPRALFTVLSVNKYLVLIVSACIGVPVYLVGLRLAKVQELVLIVGMIKSKYLKNNR